VDVGGAIRGMRIDVFMRDVGQALEFGRRQVRVRVFEQVKVKNGGGKR